MSEETRSGFEAVVHLSLTQPILIGGVPRAYAILNGTFCAVIGLGLQQLFLAIPLFLIVHGLGVWWTKRDAYWLDVLRRHLREKNFYEA